jgi:hypothetical protein
VRWQLLLHMCLACCVDMTDYTGMENAERFAATCLMRHLSHAIGTFAQTPNIPGSSRLLLAGQPSELRAGNAYSHGCLRRKSTVMRPPLFGNCEKSFFGPCLKVGRSPDCILFTSVIAHNQPLWLDTLGLDNIDLLV